MTKPPIPTSDQLDLFHEDSRRHVQEQLDKCSTYAGEEEFVKQHEEEVRERKIVSKLRGQK